MKIDTEDILEYIRIARGNVLPYEDARDSGYDDALYDLESYIEELQKSEHQS